MDPKQKAIELTERFQNIEFPAPGFDDFEEPNTRNMGFERVKQCCLITIQEIICSNPHSNPLNTNVYSTFDYWQQVKQEIELMET